MAYIESVSRLPVTWINVNNPAWTEPVHALARSDWLEHVDEALAMALSAKAETQG